MNKYGITYQGSKNQIAEKIINALPCGNRFVDLFGGGFAMSHCALLSKKWNKVYYNELNPLLPELIQKALSGVYNPETFKPEWITREKFKELKNKDGYIKYCWSFGTNGRHYLYSKEIEHWKKALHYARVFNDFSLFKQMGITTDGSPLDIKAHFDEYKVKYIKWYLETILKKPVNFEELKQNLDNKIKMQKEDLRLYLCNALKQAGLRPCDANKRLNTQMSGRYFSKSQWEFPTRETYEKMREFMPLDDYDKIYGCQELLDNIKNLKSLESLQRLERLESLERLKEFDNLTINCGDYREYKYQEGDIVYCDPPYENTAGYREEDKKKTSFNSKEFYEWVRAADFPVYFSSYPIDEGFKKVLEVQKRSLLANGSRDLKCETIYSNGVLLNNVINFTQGTARQLSLNLSFT